MQQKARETLLRKLAESLGSDFLVDVDVTDDASLDAAFASLAERWGELDFLVHAIAYSDKNELQSAKKYAEKAVQESQISIDLSKVQQLHVEAEG